MIILKVLVLQLFWFLVVCLGHSLPDILFFSIAITLVISDFVLFKPQIEKGRLSYLIFIFLAFGIFNDFSLQSLGLISKDFYHWNALSLWIVFPLYYEEIFKKFCNLPVLMTTLVGGLGGAMTYFSAAKLGGLQIQTEKETPFLIFEFLFWAAFFPWSIKLYFKTDYWNKFLDKTILFSFDQTGFKRHEKSFTDDFKGQNLAGKKIFVTGGTSGIGEYVSTFLASLEADVFFSGRNMMKGQEIENQGAHLKFVSLDMSNWRDILEFAKNCEIFDSIVLNAGGMPEELQFNNNGIELQCASQLMGHYYLLLWLKKFDKIQKGAKIVWVSSGGMYLKKLDINSLFKNDHYDKVDTYANVKRAQVTLAEEMAKEKEWMNYSICCMHPGWVKTEGLKEALPKFYFLLKNRLRTTAAGADTILWCLLTKTPLESGAFYFDRKKVSPYISQKYVPTMDQRKDLLKMLNEFRP